MQTHEIAETTDHSAEQTLADRMMGRVRLPGFFNEKAAHSLYTQSPEEFDALKVGVDEAGGDVYVMFWRTPAAAQA